MENNITMVIDALCTKLGTTMENLIPAIVEFGKYDCQITARCCTWCILFGVVLIALGYLLDKYTDADFIPGMLFVIGVITIFISTFILMVALATLSEWNHCPEVMAYKYIISMIT